MSAAFVRPLAAASALGLFGLLYVNNFGAAAPTVPAPTTNRAFVFVKPHAVTDKVNELVKTGLQAQGLKVSTEGELTSEEIDRKKLIDQHYYSIASKATILTPDQLNVDGAKFKAQFNKEWKDVLASGKAFNALDGCKELGVDADKMNKLWAECKKANKLVKLGGGFYCGELNYNGKTIYVFNGFFMEMRAAYTNPGRRIHYYTVSWDPAKLSWADFRGKLLGPTDPKDAPKDSLRGKVLGDWKNLGLKAEPNVGDNGIHASASPFEGMAERLNWLGVKCQDDDFCDALLRQGIPESVVTNWCTDPQVKINAEGKKGSLFDQLEDMDVAPCLKKLNDLYALNKK
jgi:nucleoside diphosphate kinase